MLIVGREEDPEFQTYRRTMEQHRVPSDVLTPEALAQRFPGIHPHGGEMAVSDQTAGVLYADKALQAVQVWGVGAFPSPSLFWRHPIKNYTKWPDNNLGSF